MLLLRFRAEQCAAGLVDQAGTPKYVFHMLRHFFASWAISRNFQAKRLQEMLGHSSITMTYDTYGHLFPAEADDQMRMSEGARAVLSAHSDIFPT